MLCDLAPEQIKETLEHLAYPNLSRRFDLVRTVGYREGSALQMVEEAETIELAR